MFHLTEADSWDSHAFVGWVLLNLETTGKRQRKRLFFSMLIWHPSFARLLTLDAWRYLMVVDCLFPRAGGGMSTLQVLNNDPIWGSLLPSLTVRCAGELSVMQRGSGSNYRWQTQTTSPSVSLLPVATRQRNRGTFNTHVVNSGAKCIKGPIILYVQNIEIVFVVL